MCGWDGKVPTRKALYGVYGVTVNTRVCGTRNQGSIPCRHPSRENPLKGDFLVGEIN